MKINFCGACVVKDDVDFGIKKQIQKPTRTQKDPNKEPSKPKQVS